MKNIISLLSICMLLVGMIPFDVLALTPKEEKGVKTLKSDRLDRESPDWFTPFSLIDAPKDIEYWKSIIPYEGAQDHDAYVVMPTLGLITPVIFVPEGTADHTNMSQGKEIDINKYLDNGVMHYPNTGLPGTVGNPVIFGHSNFFSSGQGRYKTIFADIMNLDVGYEDEVWVYLREKGEEEFDLRKFAIEKSYDTVPTDVAILNPQGGKELTVFACTNGLEGRWILRTRLIEQDETLVPYDLKFRLLGAIEKLESFPEDRQQEIINEFITALEEVRGGIESDGYEDKFKEYLLKYFEKKVSK